MKRLAGTLIGLLFAIGAQAQTSYPMLMTLQRKLLAWIHHNTFNLKTRTLVYGIKTAPGTIDSPVLVRLTSTLRR